MLTGKRLAKAKRQYRGRVRFGAELLDSKYVARGWRKKVYASVLTMQYPTTCIVGQAFGNFFDGLKRLGLGTLLTSEERQAGWRYGFNLPIREQHWCGHKNYQRWSLLAEAWRNRLARDARVRKSHHA